MKRKTKLWILVGVLVVCIAGYNIASAIAKNAEVEEESTDITVTSFDASSVSGLSWEYDGESCSLSKTDSVWYNDADEDFPVKQSTVSTMTSQISSITASAVVNDVTDYTEYGLDEPSMELYLLTQNGGELRFEIGDCNPVTGDYYLRITEGGQSGTENQLYLVPSSLITAFSYHMDDLIQTESLPDFSDIESVKVESSETYRLSYMGDDQELPWVLRIDGSKVGANETAAEELVSDLQYLSFVGVADYQASKADLSDYGLDDPYAVLTVDYLITSTSSDSSSETDEESITLTIGSTDEDGNYYLMIEGYTMIYTIDTTIPDWIATNDTTVLSDLSDSFSNTTVE